MNILNKIFGKNEPPVNDNDAKALKELLAPGRHAMDNPFLKEKIFKAVMREANQDNWEREDTIARSRGRVSWAFGGAALLALVVVLSIVVEPEEESITNTPSMVAAHDSNPSNSQGVVTPTVSQVVEVSGQALAYLQTQEVLLKQDDQVIWPATNRVSVKNGRLAVRLSEQTGMILEAEESQAMVGLSHNTSDNRRFNLVEGSCYFQVKPLDASQVFVVDSQSYSARVVGTAFRAWADPIPRVRVYSGKVRISQKDKPDEMVRAGYEWRPSGITKLELEREYVAYGRHDYSGFRGIPGSRTFTRTSNGLSEKFRDGRDQARDTTKASKPKTGGGEIVRQEIIKKNDLFSKKLIKARKLLKQREYVLAHELLRPMLDKYHAHPRVSDVGALWVRSWRGLGEPKRFLKALNEIEQRFAGELLAEFVVWQKALLYLDELGKPDKSLEVMTRARSKVYAEDLQWTRVRAQLRLKDYPAAASALQQFVTRYATSHQYVRALIFLGTIERDKLEHPKMAVGHFEKAFEAAQRRTEREEALFGWGMALRRAHDKAAQQVFAKYMKLFPNGAWKSRVESELSLLAQAKRKTRK